MTFGHLFIKVITKFSLKDTTISRIPVKDTKKLKTSNLPQRTEVIVKYKEISIPNINNIILQSLFIFIGTGNFTIIFYTITLYSAILELFKNFNLQITLFSRFINNICGFRFMTNLNRSDAVCCCTVAKLSIFIFTPSP